MWRRERFAALRCPRSAANFRYRRFRKVRRARSVGLRPSLSLIARWWVCLVRSGEGAGRQLGEVEVVVRLVQGGLHELLAAPGGATRRRVGEGAEVEVGGRVGGRDQVADA